MDSSRNGSLSTSMGWNQELASKRALTGDCSPDFLEPSVSPQLSSLELSLSLKLCCLEFVDLSLVHPS